MIVPRYEYDPSKVTSSIEVFPKDDYMFKVGAPKAFIRQNSKDEESVGVRFSLEVTEGQYKGKRTVFTCYLHNEGSQSMTKRFHMACYGYKAGPLEEAKFNMEHGGDDWSFNPETGECGEAWKKMTGCMVAGSLDVGVNNKTSEPQQNFKTWRPAVSN
jgi:hypothetical protein